LSLPYITSTSQLLLEGCGAALEHFIAISLSGIT
jgi:hypothetical protein